MTGIWIGMIIGITWYLVRQIRKERRIGEEYREKYEKLLKDGYERAIKSYQIPREINTAYSEERKVFYNDNG